MRIEKEERITRTCGRAVSGVMTKQYLSIVKLERLMVMGPIKDITMQSGICKYSTCTETTKIIYIYI